jgi:hypothetical protein
MELDYLKSVYDKLQEQFAHHSCPQGNPKSSYDKLQEQFAQRSCPQGNPHGCGL